MGWPSKPPKLCFGMPTNTDTEAGREATARDTYGLGAEDLLDFYRLMVTARRVDDREISLKRQNKIFFQISGAGHEAIQVALARHCRSAHDWFYFYYRDRAFSLALGQTPLDHLLQAVAAEVERLVDFGAEKAADIRGVGILPAFV